MPQKESDFGARVLGARDKLADQFLHHPDVSLIDIGYPITHDQTPRRIVLRIHVKEQWVKAKPEERAAFPTHVDDIPVIVMMGDYGLEMDPPVTDED